MAQTHNVHQAAFVFILGLVAGTDRYEAARKFKGLAWLFMGVPYSKSLLYDDDPWMPKKG